MAKITLQMNMHEVFIEMSEMNPGALNACMELFKNSESIDPDSAMGGLAPLLSLDTHGIYGSRLYQLHNDVCGRDVEKMLAVIRAVQLGLISSGLVDNAIEASYQHTLDLDDILLKVKERLPKFGVKAESEPT